MGRLFDSVRQAVQGERYLFSDHADNMLRERSIMHWQIAQGVVEGHLRLERPQTKPNPTVEVEQILADGTSVNCVWAYLEVVDFAKLVTVHFFDR